VLESEDPTVLKTVRLGENAASPTHSAYAADIFNPLVAEWDWNGILESCDIY
jgi:hypothetical protein